MTAPVRMDLLTALLRHFEWSPSGGVPGRYEVWSPIEESDRSEILVPLDPSRRDFATLAERARRAVFSHYGRAARDVSSVLETTVRASLEATEWQRETPAGGLISWEEGETLYASARAQLLASAKSTKEHKRFHGNSSAHIAKRFLEQSFMGQTAVGSFIITAYTPANARIHVSKHSEDLAGTRPRSSETVLSGEIMDTFERALRAVRSGLDEYRRAPPVSSHFWRL